MNDSEEHDFPYTVAVVALKHTSGTYDLRLPLERMVFLTRPKPTTAVMADYVVAASEEEAKSKALQKARELYPPSQGWTDHRAIACPIDVNSMMWTELEEIKDKALRKMLAEVSASDDELVM